MISLINALGIIIIFYVIESYLRYGKEAKSFKATEKDKNSTSYLMILIGLNTIALISGFLLDHLNIYVLFHNSWIGWCCNLIMVIGLFIRVTATRTLREYYTRTLKIQAHQKIIDIGFYRYLRHPGYLGVIMIWIGAGLSSHNYFVLVMISLMTFIAYHYRMNSEEKMLTEAFGEVYTLYKKRTWRIIPFIY